MRYVCLIAVVNFLVLVVADDLIGHNLIGGALGAFFICLFAIPFAIAVGFPMLWIARRIKEGSALVLVSFGTLAGSLTPFVVSVLLGSEPNGSMVVVGGTLGFISSSLWWALVERWPDLRAHYE